MIKWNQAWDQFTSDPFSCRPPKIKCFCLKLQTMTFICYYINDKCKFPKYKKSLAKKSLAKKLWQSENEDGATSKVSLNIWKGNVKMTWSMLDLDHSKLWKCKNIENIKKKNCTIGGWGLPLPDPILEMLAHLKMEKISLEHPKVADVVRWVFGGLLKGKNDVRRVMAAKRKWILMENSMILRF